MILNVYTEKMSWSLNMEDKLDRVLWLQWSYADYGGFPGGFKWPFPRGSVWSETESL